MSNLTQILTYLRASALIIAYIFLRDRLAAVPTDSGSKYMNFCLVSVAVMVIFTVSEFWELRERHRRQQNRLAASELDMMDIEGRTLPEPDLPEFYDDGFMLPPLIDELLIALELDTLDVNDRFLLESELSDLDEDDESMLSPPAGELFTALELDMLDVDDRLLLELELPDLDEDDDFMLPPPAYEDDVNMLRN